ncbi:MAG: CPBP family intramembrane glutamic endopeptidase [Pseudomonadota bacterium]
MMLALPFLIFVGILIPALGWLGLRHAASADSGPLPGARAMAVQLAVVQTLVAGLALIAWAGADVELAWIGDISPTAALVAVGALALFVGLAALEARRPLGARDRLRAELRKASAKDPVWIGVTLYAGVVEEFAYRGVLVLVLAGLIGPWAAFAASAVLFALGHLSGGWRAALLGVPFALAMHIVVTISGGLLLAILVHAAYDLIGAALGHRLVRMRAPRR